MVKIEVTENIQYCPFCGWKKEPVGNKLNNGICPECKHKPLHNKTRKVISEE